MPLTPSGVLNEPLVQLKTFLSNCATFQSVTGAANAAAALAYIFLYDKETLPAAHNYAIVDHAGGWGKGRRQLDNAWTPAKGSLWLELTVAIPSEQRSDPEEAHVYATNKFGAILGELQTYASGNQSLVIYDWRIAMGPIRADEEARNGDIDWISVLVEVEAA